MDNKDLFIAHVLGDGFAAPFSQRVKYIPALLRAIKPRPFLQFDPPIDREAVAVDTETGERKKVLMFASNNYLGLWSHPYVQEQVGKAVQTHGTGGGGSPWVNGRLTLQQVLEERLCALMGVEATLIFSSAYAANVGMGMSLPGPSDLVLYDRTVHQSLRDGMRLAAGRTVPFEHDDVTELERLVAKWKAEVRGDIFVAAQGVHALDGTLAPLDRLVPLCTRYGAFLILDDIHGFGVEGPTGLGAAEHFGVQKEIGLTLSTFSTIFGVQGSFVASSREVIDYLRISAHPYIFSTALSPLTVATVLAGLDVLEREPERLGRLRENVNHVVRGLTRVGLSPTTRGGIITLPASVHEFDLPKAFAHLWSEGVFVHFLRGIVPDGKERFRIGISANHTRADLDRLIGCLEALYATCRVEPRLEAAGNA